MQALGPDTALKVEDFSVRRGEDMIDLHFEIVNSGDAKLYEFVKMYVGPLYVGLEYMHLDPGETHVIEFQANARTVSPDDDVLLTTESKEEGIIFDRTLDELLSIPDESEDEPEPDQAVAGQPKEIREELEELKQRDIPEKRWEELEDEFENLQGEEKEKKKILERLREEYEKITGDKEGEDEPHGVEAAPQGDEPAEQPSRPAEVQEGGTTDQEEAGSAAGQERPGTGDVEPDEADERPVEGAGTGETQDGPADSVDDEPERPTESPSGSPTGSSDEEPEEDRAGEEDETGTAPVETERSEETVTDDDREDEGDDGDMDVRPTEDEAPVERPAERPAERTGAPGQEGGEEDEDEPAERPAEEGPDEEMPGETTTGDEDGTGEESEDAPWKPQEVPGDETDEEENDGADSGEEIQEEEGPPETGEVETAKEESPETGTTDETPETTQEPSTTVSSGTDDGTAQPDRVEAGGSAGKGSGPDAAEAAGEPDEVEKKVREFEKRQDEEDEPEKNVVRSVVDSIFGSSHDEEPDGEIEEPEEGQEDDDEEDEDDEEGYEYQDEDELPPSMQVDRVTTGVEGLDEKMQGGFVQGTMNLVTGKTGVGKTAFCANFLKGGADKGESGVYVTTEERQEDIRADIEAMFGWSFEEMEERGLVKILSIKPIFPSKEIDNLNRLVRSYISNLLDEVMAAVDEIDAQRVIIDSVSIIEMFIRDEYMARVALASLLNKLREADVTALLTGTVPETSEGLSGGGIIEFLVDTVLLLEFVPVAEEHKRTLTIRKMRRTDHRTEIFPFDITPDGIKIFDPQGGMM